MSNQQSAFSTQQGVSQQLPAASCQDKRQVTEHNRLASDLFGIKMNSPLMTASGTYGYGKEFANFYDLNLLGAIVVKGITMKPRAGNSGQRLIETPAGLINSIGLENPGVEGFLVQEMPFLRESGVPV
ncbi:MAG TPA: hypothetical protein VK905_06030, partial [Bacillota bacterium]|nr:hypothetical protein [Bacillota bacterium]